MGLDPLGGTGKDKGKRHPTLGNNVTVGSGAKVLGPFKIGNDVKIAANAVVLQEAPSGATLVGVPARVVRLNGRKVPQPLDHIHMPDPVAQELRQLTSEMRELRLRVALLETGGVQGEEETVE